MWRDRAVQCFKTILTDMCLHFAFVFVYHVYTFPQFSRAGICRTVVFFFQCLFPYRIVVFCVLVCVCVSNFVFFVFCFFELRILFFEFRILNCVFYILHGVFHNQGFTTL